MKNKLFIIIFYLFFFYDRHKIYTSINSLMDHQGMVRARPGPQQDASVSIFPDMFSASFVAFLVSVFLSFIPLIFNITVLAQHDNINDIVQDRSLYTMFMCVFSAFFVFLCDIFMDHFEIMDSVNPSVSFKELFIYERYLATIAVVLPSIGLMILPSSGTCLLILEKVQTIVAAYCISLVLLRADGEKISKRKLEAAAIMVYFSRVFSIFSSISVSMDILGSLLLFLGAITFAYSIYPFVSSVNVLDELYKKSSKTTVVLLYIGSTSSFFLFVVLGYILFPGQSIQCGSLNFFSYITIIFALQQIPLVMVPGRILRSQLIDEKTQVEMKSNFIRYISHELKFPINAASLGLQIVKERLLRLQMSIVLQAEMLSLFTETTESLNTAIRMLVDISTLVKLNSKLMKVEKRLTKLPDFVRSSLQVFKIKARKKLISFDLSAFNTLEASSFYLYIDKPKMVQVMRNLVSNAFKATPDGGRVTISFRIITSEISTRPSCSRFLCKMFNGNRIMHLHSNPVQYLRLEVIDNGIGMLPEKVDSLFLEDEFDKNLVDESPKGLIISKKFVDMHEGRIGGYSPGLNQGSIFYVDIPWDLSTSQRVVSLSEVGSLPGIVHENSHDLENGVSLIESNFISDSGQLISSPTSILGVETPIHENFRGLLPITELDSDLDIMLHYDESDIDSSEESRST